MRNVALMQQTDFEEKSISNNGISIKLFIYFSFDIISNIKIKKQTTLTL